MDITILNWGMIIAFVGIVVWALSSERPDDEGQ